jgi:hypothetical protein
MVVVLDALNGSSPVSAVDHNLTGCKPVSPESLLRSLRSKHVMTVV